MSSALVLGATGLTGSHILSLLRAGGPSPFTSVEVIARRSTNPAPEAKVQVKEFVDKDTATWVSHVASSSPAHTTLISSLGTTRAAAGGFENQYKLEHDLNIEIAKAAKERGTKHYILVSAAGANLHSHMAYPRMKAEIEEHIKELGFEHTIILRPGLIGGSRQESRPTEAILRTFAAGLGMISSSLTDFWMQDAEIIAKAAVLAAIRAEKGEIKDKVVLLGQSDIVRLGRKEWPAAS